MKIVECAGDKIVDFLHKSNPWEDYDCDRKECYTCKTSVECELPFKNCTKRSVIYNTWCETCEKKKERAKKEDVFDDEVIGLKELFATGKEKEKIGRKRKVEKEERNKCPAFVYIGETSRSAYERGQEHSKDLEFKRHKSHMLKHCVNHHDGMNPENVKFGMKILSSHKTAFERQIREAVLIEKNAGPTLMNSKTEYNRCSIPRIVIKMGNEEEVVDPTIKKEREVIEKIKLMYPNERKRSNDGGKNFEKKVMTKNRNKRQKIEGHTTILEENEENQGRLSTLKSDLLPVKFPPKIGPYSDLRSEKIRYDSNGEKYDSNGEIDIKIHSDSNGACHIDSNGENSNIRDTI